MAGREDKTPDPWDAPAPDPWNTMAQVAANSRPAGQPKLTVHRGGKAPGAVRNGGLTQKQMGFARAMVKGRSQADAYRETYDAEGMAPNTIWKEASKLLLNPKVSGYINALNKRQEEAALHSALSLRRLVVERLVHEAKGAGSDSARVRALELIGKLSEVSAFTERIEQVDADATPEEIKARLVERLRQVFGGERLY